MGSGCITQAGLKLQILLALPANCWEYYRSQLRTFVKRPFIAPDTSLSPVIIHYPVCSQWLKEAGGMGEPLSHTPCAESNSNFRLLALPHSVSSLPG